MFATLDWDKNCCLQNTCIISLSKVIIFKVYPNINSHNILPGMPQAFQDIVLTNFVNEADMKKGFTVEGLCDRNSCTAT